jgi:hypothetical protein
MARVVHWAGQTLTDLPDDATVDEIREALEPLFPAIADAVAREEGDEIYFELQSGSKG